MKNLFYIFILLLIFSCGGEAKTNNNSAKTTSQPTETKQNQVISDVGTPQSPTENASKVLTSNEITEEVSHEKTTTEVPVENIPLQQKNTPKLTGEKTTATSIPKNETEAKAQIEAEKAKALANKMHVEVEMKMVEDAKKAKAAADAKIRKEMEARKAAAEKTKKENEKTKPTSEATLHDGFDTLLKKHVSSSGKVNYKGLKNDEGKLNSYLQKLEKTNIEKSWSRNKKLAFWINAYNAYTIKLILKNYPVKSIMDLHNGKPWDAKWIKLDQRTLSLNNIENDIIRPKFNEPRIHFAVNCAAKSCPPLLNKAWTANNLNSNFERQTKSFVNNSNYNSITSEKVEVSKIFDWYGKDFGDLKTYLNKYSNTKIASGTSINFKSYNWDLNN